MRLVDTLADAFRYLAVIPPELRAAVLDETARIVAGEDAEPIARAVRAALSPPPSEAVAALVEEAAHASESERNEGRVRLPDLIDRLVVALAASERRAGAAEETIKRVETFAAALDNSDGGDASVMIARCYAQAIRRMLAGEAAALTTDGDGGGGVR